MNEVRISVIGTFRLQRNRYRRTLVPMLLWWESGVVPLTMLLDRLLKYCSKSEAASCGAVPYAIFHACRSTNVHHGIADPTLAHLCRNIHVTHVVHVTNSLPCQGGSDETSGFTPVQLATCHESIKFGDTRRNIFFYLHGCCCRKHRIARLLFQASRSLLSHPRCRFKGLGLFNRPSACCGRVVRRVT